jgi:hypothetical protein
MSPTFFALPRELRDMIYIFLITSSNALPDPESTHDRHAWQLNNGAWFSRALPPRTSCASMLATNRQVHEELMHAIERARQAGLLVAKLDCIVKDRCEDGLWFTWLLIPLISRKMRKERKPEEKKRLVVNLKNWGSNVPVVGRLFPSLQLRKGPESAVQESPRVSIERLQIDIRMFEIRAVASPSQRDEGSRIQWAICSALKRICQHKHEVWNIEGWPKAVTIDTLILNVVSAAPVKLVPKDSANSAMELEKDNAQLLARDLIDVWNTIWSNSHRQSQHLTVLLERIKRVKVCVDEALIGERELRLELERGQAERRRIAMRVGW